MMSWPRRSTWKNSSQKSVPKEFLELLGPKKFIKQGGIDWLLSQMSPEDLKKLKERLK